MEKHKIVVPEEIRYISDWEDYRLEDYNFPHILNKVVTGCGYTEFCIRNGQNLILVSPRKFLLQNKLDQHPDVYYVRNELETSIDYELDVSKDDTKRIDEKKKETDSSDLTTITNLEILKMKLKEYVNKMHEENKPCKILVTYDSFRHVKSALGENIKDFQVVVDEFQSIFMDSRFKSNTELEFLTHLNGQEMEGGYKIQKVCYVSATPMLDKYLEMLNEFKDLPYYELDWESKCPGRIKRPKLDIKFTYGSLKKEVKLIIQKYLNGKFEERIDPGTGQFIQSREAVIFLNSVDGICKAIRNNMLLPEQCNIICADSTANKKNLRSAFNTVYKKLDEGKKKPRCLLNTYNPIGEIPLKGEPHKMFTFCTRTVYLGADFYSTNARTFIFSDSNVDCLSVDISMDLEQILGRQRLDENPWKNTATLIIKTTKEAKQMRQEHFNNIISLKKKKSENLLTAFDELRDELRSDLAEKYLEAVDKKHYKKDYVAVNRFIDKDGRTYLKPVFNNLMLVSEIRAFEVQQVEYKDRFVVLSAVKGEGISGIDDNIIQFAKDFNELKNVKEKLRLMVEFSELPEISEKEMNCFLDLVPDKYREYYEIVTPEVIRANSFQESEIKKEWRRRTANEAISENLVNEIMKIFKKGEKYSKENIKQSLKDLYNRIGFSSTPKASDLELYFYLKTVKIKDPGGKWVNGFEIVAKR